MFSSMLFQKPKTKIYLRLHTVTVNVFPVQHTSVFPDIQIKKIFLEIINLR